MCALAGVAGEAVLVAAQVAWQAQERAAAEGLFGPDSCAAGAFLSVDDAGGDGWFSAGQDVAIGWSQASAGAGRARLGAERAVGLSEAELATGLAGGAGVLTMVLAGVFVGVREGVARGVHTAGRAGGA